MEALAAVVCTALDASTLVPLWSRCQMLDLSELDHPVSSHDPDYKEIVMLGIRHKKI